MREKEHDTGQGAQLNAQGSSLRALGTGVDGENPVARMKPQKAGQRARLLRVHGLGLEAHRGNPLLTHLAIAKRYIPLPL
jgi:hypothetical protein